MAAQPRVTRTVLLTASVALALGCESSGLSPKAVDLAGQWGAVHAALTVSDSLAVIEYDCAHGGFALPIHPDRAGRFEVTGVHVREHGGPVRSDEVPDSISARYIGQLFGSRMTLRVLVASDTLGPFELKRDVAAQLFKCL